jgi:hypothetical protein
MKQWHEQASTSGLNESINKLEEHTGYSIFFLLCFWFPPSQDYPGLVGTTVGR